MTEKRFTTDNGSNEDVCLVDNLTKKEYESNFNDIVDLMNKNWEQTQRFEKHNQYLEKENEKLKKQNKELKLDNDIKFWKHQFMMSYSASQIIMHEISRAIDEGYEVSEKFQKYLNELKVQNDENKEKMERLGI